MGDKLIAISEVIVLDISYTAPAKLNLFLHINGRRNDGYHELETLFVFLDYGDKLHFEITQDRKITLIDECTDILQENNLIYRAARLLQNTSQCKLGARIKLEKYLPMGGGVGGGSSDAATCLLALNKHWDTKLSINELAELGKTLGADVPVFIRGFSAIAHGIGEQLTQVEIEQQWYLVVHPNVHVSTAEIFSHQELPRDTKKLTQKWRNSQVSNDCETLVKKLYPEVEKTLQWLLKYAPSKMTGTGACCFCSFETEAQARQVLKNLPTKWQGFVAKSVNVSPLHSELRKN